MQAILTFSEFVAFPVLLAVEPRGGQRKDKCGLSSPPFSFKPGVLKTPTHRSLQVKVTLDLHRGETGPETGGGLPQVPQLAACRAEAGAPECRSLLCPGLRPPRPDCSSMACPSQMHLHLMSGDRSPCCAVG